MLNLLKTTNTDNFIDYQVTDKNLKPSKFRKFIKSHKGIIYLILLSIFITMLYGIAIASKGLIKIVSEYNKSGLVQSKIVLTESKGVRQKLSTDTIFLQSCINDETGELSAKTEEIVNCAKYIFDNTGCQLYIHTIAPKNIQYLTNYDLQQDANSYFSKEVNKSNGVLLTIYQADTLNFDNSLYFTVGDDAEKYFTENMQTMAKESILVAADRYTNMSDVLNQGILNMSQLTETDGNLKTVFIQTINGFLCIILICWSIMLVISWIIKTKYQCTDDFSKDFIENIINN